MDNPTPTTPRLLRARLTTKAAVYHDREATPFLDVRDEGFGMRTGEPFYWCDALHTYLPASALSALGGAAEAAERALQGAAVDPIPCVPSYTRAIAASDAPPVFTATRTQQPHDWDLVIPHDHPERQPLTIHVRQRAAGDPVEFEAVDYTGRVIGSASWDLFEGRTQLLVYDGTLQDIAAQVRFRPPTPDEQDDATDTGARVAEVVVQTPGGTRTDPRVLTNSPCAPLGADSPWLEDASHALSSPAA